MELNNENLHLIREHIENVFKEILKESGDISIYLHYPPEFLSDFVKDHLDTLLMTKAFEEISREEFNFEDFIVYRDDNMTITLEENDQKIEALEKLINYFVSIEEYEKCAKVKQILNKIK